MPPSKRWANLNSPSASGTKVRTVWVGKPVWEDKGLEPAWQGQRLSKTTKRDISAHRSAVNCSRSTQQTGGRTQVRLTSKLGHFSWSKLLELSPNSPNSREEWTQTFRGLALRPKWTKCLCTCVVHVKMLYKWVLIPFHNSLFLYQKKKVMFSPHKKC